MRAWFLLGLCAWILQASAAETGYIQVKSVAGVRIYLDNAEKGVTSEDVGGLILKDVSPGVHKVSAKRAGFESQEATLRVLAEQVALLELAAWRRLTTVEPRLGPQIARHVDKLGSVLIRSVPVDVEIEVPNLAIESTKKSTPELFLDKVPVGVYQITARFADKTIAADVVVKENGQAVVMFDFVRELAVDQSREGNAIGMVFVPLKAAKFLMGSSDLPAERRVEVTLSQDIEMSEHEVTAGQWRQVMGTDVTNEMLAGMEPQQPVVVGWEDARAFMTALAKLEGREPGVYRLPTQAEWEYACKAGKDRDYYGPIDEVAWYRSTSAVAQRNSLISSRPVLQLQPVGRKTPNAWGLFDMHGSQWEWCLDACDAEKVDAGPLRATNYGWAVSTTDPVGHHGDFRAVRGGDYSSSKEECSATFPGAYPPNFSAGFRIVRVAKPDAPLASARQAWEDRAKERFEAAVQAKIQEWLDEGRTHIVLDYITNRKDPVIQEANRRFQRERDLQRAEEVKATLPNDAAEAKREAADAARFDAMVQEELERIRRRDAEKQKAAE